MDWEIITSYPNQTHTQKYLANKYKVTAGAISKINTKRTWTEY